MCVQCFLATFGLGGGGGGRGVVLLMISCVSLPVAIGTQIITSAHALVKCLPLSADRKQF